MESSKRHPNFTTDRPVAVLMVFLAAVVFGYFSLGRLPVTLMPEMSYPTLTVRTEYPGAAPEEVENDVSRPVEEALGVIGGLRRISSISRAGVSDVVLEFTWDTDVSDATQETLEKLDLVFLPDQTERPLVLHYDPQLDPVMELSLSGKGERFSGEDGLRRLRRLADYQIKRQLEPIKGVAAVRVRGGLEEEIHVFLDEEQLRRSGLSIQNVIDRLAQENINVAGGTITEGRTEYMVRTLNEYEDLDQIADTVITRLDGRDVRIADLGEVRTGHLDRELMTRTDGGESVQIDVFKEADANIVALAAAVRGRLGDFDPEKAAERAAAGEGASGSGRGGGGPPGGGRGGRGAGGPGGPAGLAAELWQNEGVRLQVVADRSQFIEGSIDDVVQAAVFGGLLAVLILYLFLRRFSSTAIVAVSIPASLFITFAPLNMFGISLNVMSLGGLALGIGMLVDSSIVVLESIFRCREEGDGIVEAAIRGTEEVRGAVVASTLTSIAVFFPMVFVEGVAGEAFGDLGIAVVVSLLASLAVSVFLIPMLASRQWGQVLSAGGGERRLFGRFRALPTLRDDFAGARRLMRWRHERRQWLWLLALPLRLVAFVLRALWAVVRFLIALACELIAALFVAAFAAVLFVGAIVVRAVGFAFGFLFRPVLWVTSYGLDRLQNGYPKVLSWWLARPVAVLVLVAGVLAVSWFAASGLGSELLPEVHQGEVTFEVDLPVGTPLEETDRILQPVEEAILAEREHIEALIVSVGFDAANSQRSDEGEHTARFKMLLEDSTPATEEAVIDRIRHRLAQVPDLGARVTRPVLFSTRTPIEIEVHGDDLLRLKEYGDRVREVMASMPQLADVETSLVSGAPEVQVLYDRDLLSRYGLNLRQVAEQVRNQVKGFEATKYNLKDRRVPIIVRLSEADRSSVEDVRDLRVNPGGERPILLASVAEVRLGEGPSEVRRIDGQRVAVVSANMGDGSLGEAVTAIERRLDAEIDWPTGMTYFIGGQNEEWERSRGSLYLALALSIFLVYVIMAAQFESLLQPLVIMFTIPLAFFGTMLALWLFGIPLSIVVFLGMIMLAGIVVNNAIVLVDYVNTLRARGLERREALVTAGQVRLRPILMTTATTALGLLPMALGVGDGAELRTPMAIAVISGLVTSTLLTLIVIPSIYDLVEGARDRLFGGAAERTGVDEAEAVEERGGETGHGGLTPEGAHG
ncbi:MAG TPA: efflux RND transporter permease subunit [Thermoanaerobaculia bacterium]|nr:efflux RND transporter permease subunit [Thermoanaerobaculia bacterium]